MGDLLAQINQAMGRSSPPSISWSYLHKTDRTDVKMPVPEDQLAIQCFLSYAHGDEDTLSFIDEFKAALSHFAYSDRGRKVEIFVDHDSIGWGEEWRQRIHESARSASVFIPLVTMQYLSRPMCREELLLFVESAQDLGVAELFLPVVVLGHRFIAEDSQDPVAQRIAKRQYKDLRNAVIQGTESAEWRARMVEIANTLVDAVELAEDRLAARESAAEERRLSNPGAIEDLAEDAPGLLELDEAAAAGVNEVRELLERVTTLLGQVMAVVQPATAELASAINMPEKNSALLRFANTLEPLSVEIGQVGLRLELRTTEVDRILRDAWAMARDHGGAETAESFRTSLRGATDSLSELEPIGGVISEFLTSLQPAEVLSVSLRKAFGQCGMGSRRFEGHFRLCNRGGL
jgi:hypothetical protein